MGCYCCFAFPGIGYIAYALMSNGLEVLNKKTAVGLSDPVCDKQHFRTMAEAFIKEHPKAMWVQVRSIAAGLLRCRRQTWLPEGRPVRLAKQPFAGHMQALPN